MIVFLTHAMPRSVNAKGTHLYKDAIVEALLKHVPEPAVYAEELYAAIYYFHRVRTSQDADNISKPVLDALEGVLYQNDKVVKVRHAAMIDLQSRAIEAFDLSRVPNEVFKALIESLDQQEHTVYVEIGRLDYRRQVQFGYEAISEG